MKFSFFSKSNRILPLLDTKVLNKAKTGASEDEVVPIRILPETAKNSPKSASHVDNEELEKFYIPLPNMPNISPLTQIIELAKVGIPNQIFFEKAEQAFEFGKKANSPHGFNIQEINIPLNKMTMVTSEDHKEAWTFDAIPYLNSVTSYRPQQKLGQGKTISDKELYLTQYVIMPGNIELLIKAAQSESKKMQGPLPELYDNARTAFEAARTQYPQHAIMLVEVKIPLKDCKNKDDEFENIYKHLLQSASKVTSYNQFNKKFEEGKPTYTSPTYTSQEETEKLFHKRPGK